MTSTSARRGTGDRDGALDTGAVRRRNAAAAATAVLQHASVSRAEIARLTGLTPGAVTKIVADLIARDVLTEGTPSVGGTGRPRIPLLPAPAPYRVGGIHIGLRWCSGALVDLSGRVVEESTIVHTSRRPASVLRHVRTLVERLETAAGEPTAMLGLGMSTGGWVDPDAMTVVSHPGMDWHGVDLASGIGPRGYPVQVDNTVRAVARAESLFGATRDGRLSMHAFVGNFVGVSVSQGSLVHHGAQGAAGIIDHLPVGSRGPVVCRCGRRDCFGVLASDLAVTRDAVAAGIVEPSAQFEDVVARGEAGDAVAARLLRRRARRVGRALGLLGDIYDPARIVVSGNVARDEHLVDIRAGAAERSDAGATLGERIVVTDLGEHAVTRGPASLALAHFYADPLGQLADR